jgi:hypothetical protein
VSPEPDGSTDPRGRVRPFAGGAGVGAAAVLVVVFGVVACQSSDDTGSDEESAAVTSVTAEVEGGAAVEREPEAPTIDTVPPSTLELSGPTSVTGSGSDWLEVPSVPAECPAATVRVSSADELVAALTAAVPGTAIELAPGTYEGNFVATASGTENAPIFLCGSAGAVIDGGGIDEGYALHLDGVAHWRLVGFTVRNSQKGVMADGLSRSVLQGLTVEDTGDEAIHLRAASSNNSVVDNVVRRTGQRRDKFGEGIYVGSAESNWGDHSAGGPDRSDHNLIQGNSISQTTSEAIDVKEGTTGGRLVANVVDGIGMSAADAPIDIKGNGWLIDGNVVRNAPEEGMQTHRILDGWGTGNRFVGNTVDVVGGGLHFYVHDPEQTDNEISCSNATASSGPIRSNVDCIP